MKTFRVYKVARLENGIGIEMSAGVPHLKVGDSFNTQWGRKTVAAVTTHRDEVESDPELTYTNGCPTT